MEFQDQGKMDLKHDMQDGSSCRRRYRYQKEMSLTCSSRDICNHLCLLFLAFNLSLSWPIFF
jgi:hypothetical protein